MVREVHFKFTSVVENYIIRTHPCASWCGCQE